MPAKTVEEAKQVLADSLPATGEILYEDFYNDLMSRREDMAVAEFHRERRAGKIATRLERGPDGVTIMYLSRPTAQ